MSTPGQSGPDTQQYLVEAAPPNRGQKVAEALGHEGEDGPLLSSPAGLALLLDLRPQGIHLCHQLGHRNEVRAILPAEAFDPLRRGTCHDAPRISAGGVIVSYQELIPENVLRRSPCSYRTWRTPSRHPESW